MEDFSLKYKNIIVVVVVTVLVVVALLLVSGRIETPDWAGELGEEMSVVTLSVDESMDEIASVGAIAKKNSYKGEILTRGTTSSPVIRFNQSDYDLAVKEEKLILLYFVSNKDTTAPDEINNAFLPSFIEMNNPEIIGFLVNFGLEATGNEKEIARLFGVSLSKTKLVIKDNERLFKSFQVWGKDRYKKELNDILTKFK